jgi:hypothetical protein
LGKFTSCHLGTKSCKPYCPGSSPIPSCCICR